MLYENWQKVIQSHVVAKSRTHYDIRHCQTDRLWRRCYCISIESDGVRGQVFRDQDITNLPINCPPPKNKKNCSSKPFHFMTDVSYFCIKWWYLRQILQMISQLNTDCLRLALTVLAWFMDVEWWSWFEKGCDCDGCT